MKALLRLYPAAWRERYEVEVAQLLDDNASGIGDAPGLVLGAYRAHRHPGRLGLPGGGIRRWVTREHLAGLAAMAGGAFWFGTYVALWIAAMRMSQNPDLHSIALLGAAGPLLVLAIAGLLPRGVDGLGDRVLAVLALLMVIVGAVLMSVLLVRNGLADVPYIAYELEGALLVGSGLVLAGSLLATACMWGRGIASRRALALLAAGCLIDLAFLAIWAEVGFIYEVRSFAGAAAGMLVALGWVAVGWSVLRRPSRDEDAPAVIEGPSAQA